MAPRPELSHGSMRPLPRWLELPRVLVVIAAMVAGFSAQADTSFLKIEALTIDATDPNHDGWINLLAFGAGSVRGPLLPPSLGGPQASPPKFTDLTILKQIDKSSPILMKACCTGKHFPKAQIDFVRPAAGGGGGGTTYMTVTLNDVLISSYQFHGSSDVVPTEQISLNFTKFEVGHTDKAFTSRSKLFYDVGTAGISFAIGPPVNTPPTISHVPTRLGTSPQSIQFTVDVADAESAAGDLTLTGEATNAALLPATNISFSGTGGTRTVTLLPAVQQFGLTHVSLSVTDGTSSTSTQFLVIFNHPPPFPFIELSDNKIPEHSPAGTLVGRIFTNPPGAAGLTLLDNAAGRFRVESDGVVVNDPLLLDFETMPLSRITVCYTNPQTGLPYYAQFTIEVQDVPEGPFDLWRHAYFTPEELLDPAISGPDGNADNDLLKNSLEYGLCLSPKDGTDAGATPRLGEIVINNNRYLTLTYRRPPPAFDPALEVTPLLSDNFQTWGFGASHFAVLSVVLLAPDCEEITLRALVPKADDVRQLIRIQVVR